MTLGVHKTMSSQYHPFLSLPTTNCVIFVYTLLSNIVLSIIFVKFSIVDEKKEKNRHRSYK